MQWVQADLSTWNPDARYDLVTTHYAHPAMPQLEFYDRIASWVAPGGTLLIAGHLYHDAAEATSTAMDTSTAAMDRPPRLRRPRPPSRRASTRPCGRS